MGNSISFAALTLFCCLSSYTVCLAEHPDAERQTANITSYGNISYGCKSFWEIEAFGAVQMNGTCILKCLLNGTLLADDAQMETCCLHGTATFNNSIIKKKLQVEGVLEANDSQIEEIHVRGKTRLNRSVVTTGIIIGPCTATSSTFLKQITFSAKRLILEDCTVDTLLFMPTDHVLGTAQTVELRGRTIVKGSILFEVGSGTVLLSKDSVIHNRVLGAKVKVL